MAPSNAANAAMATGPNIICKGFWPGPRRRSSTYPGITVKSAPKRPTSRAFQTAPVASPTTIASDTVKGVGTSQTTVMKTNSAAQSSTVA